MQGQSRLGNFSSKSLDSVVLEGTVYIGLSIRPVIVQANWVIRPYKRGSLSLITPRIERSVNIFRPFNQKLRQLLHFYHWKEEVSKMYKEKKTIILHST